MAALEERVLEVLENGPLTWDGLRQVLGVGPGELDGVVMRLERLGSVRRDRGRILLPRSELESAPAAAATKATIRETKAPSHATAAPSDATKPPEDEPMAPTRKPCKRCGVTKPLEDFPKNKGCVGGHTPVCKPCTYAAREAAKAAKGGGSRRTSRPRAAAAEGNATQLEVTVDRELAAAIAGPQVRELAILETERGFALAYLSQSPRGLLRLGERVELTPEQLDELCELWAARKKVMR